MIWSAVDRSPYGRRTLVIGTTAAAAQFQRLLIMRPHWGSEIAGFLTVDGAREQTFCDKPVLGRMRDLEPLLDAMIVDDVVLAAPLEEAEVDRIVQTCSERGPHLPHAGARAVAAAGAARTPSRSATAST